MPAKLPDELRRKAVQVKLPPALLARVEERRKVLGLSKTEFVERALEAALGSGPTRQAARPVAPADPVSRADAFRQAARRRA